jgi:hypothetical protein
VPWCTHRRLARGAVCCTVLPRCGDSSTERKFLSDKVYRRDDRGIIGVEPFNAEGLAFFVIHTVFDGRPRLKALEACAELPLVGPPQWMEFLAVPLVEAQLPVSRGWPGLPTGHAVLATPICVSHADTGQLVEKSALA